VRAIHQRFIDAGSHNVISKAVEMFIAFPVLDGVASIYSLMIVRTSLKKVHDIPTFGSSSLATSFAES
jgi:hypothetical protein